MPRFAAIDVGSNASRLVIVDARDPLKIEPFRNARVPVRLGHSVFQSGRLDPESIDRCVGAMREFAQAMDEAEVDAYRANVTASARSASNADVLLDRVPAGVVKIMDVKCPGSGEVAHNNWSNIDLLTPADEVKFVIDGRADYEFARDIVRRYDLAARCRSVLLSPVHGELELRPLAEWVLADALPVRIQVQLHKYIWDPTTRGV